MHRASGRTDLGVWLDGWGRFSAEGGLGEAIGQRAEGIWSVKETNISEKAKDLIHHITEVQYLPLSFLCN